MKILKLTGIGVSALCTLREEGREGGEKREAIIAQSLINY